MVIQYGMCYNEQRRNVLANWGVHQSLGTRGHEEFSSFPSSHSLSNPFTAQKFLRKKFHVFAMMILGTWCSCRLLSKLNYWVQNKSFGVCRVSVMAAARGLAYTDIESKTNCVFRFYTCLLIIHKLPSRYFKQLTLGFYIRTITNHPLLSQHERMHMEIKSRIRK